MSKNVVICTNMQFNYFSSKGTSYLGGHSRIVKERISQVLRNLDYDKYEVIYTRDIRSPEDKFFSHVKTQCTVGTLDINMVDGLSRANSLVISATRPSAVWKTPLLSELRKSNPEEVYILGSETNSSVLFTAADLRYLGYIVKVPEPLVVARDEYLHNFAITLMAETLGVEVVTGI